MVPTQRNALSHARAVSGLFTVIALFSMIGPPPSETCHSRALQLRDSDDAPSHRKPQKSFWPLADLNPCGHSFELTPGSWRSAVSVMSQEVSAVIQQANVNQAWQGD